MSEQKSASERTEQPTDRRKKESRKKGQVPRSKELNTMLSLLVGAFGLLVLGDTIAADFMVLFENAFSFEREVAYDKDMIPVRFVALVVSALLILAPFFTVMVVGAFAGPLIMGGWSFSPSALAFKLEKLNVLKGVKRMFSAKSLVELLKALFKFVVISATAIFLFSLWLDKILQLGMQLPGGVFSEAVGILMWGLVILSFAMIFIVIFDVPFELWNHTRQLKMTRQEVKDEMKDTDGRPEVKSRIRALQREVSQRRMMEAVPLADVVVTNPTHVSVALKYDDTPGVAPRVLAKGYDLVALKIRSVAMENNVAIFAAPPLARALYVSTEIGDEIPQNLYLAVAKVLAYVYQLRSPNNTTYAAPPDDLSIPDEYREMFHEAELDGAE